MYTLRLFYGAVMLIALQACSSPPKSSSAEQTDPTAAISKEMAALESTIAGLEEKLHEDDQPHDEHGNATPQEIEILKTLQVLNQRLMQLERMIANGSTTSANSATPRDVVEKQVIDQAKKSLSEHALGGQSFFTSPSLIKTNFVESENLWNVSITFKKDKASTEVLEASISCIPNRYH
jgi:translation elongation factor EF-Ts